MAYEATELFIKMNAAEAAWKADDMNVDLGFAWDVAFAAFYKAVAEARKLWMDLPDNNCKFSAEINADDTEGCAEDELKWLNTALATYEECKNSGW